MKLELFFAPEIKLDCSLQDVAIEPFACLKVLLGNLNWSLTALEFNRVRTNINRCLLFLSLDLH